MNNDRTYATFSTSHVPPRAGDHKRSLDVGGVRREYLLHVPADWDGRQALPLVISFHGGGGSAKLSALATGWSDKADTERFFVVYPEGVRPHPDRPATFLRNPPFWNVGAGIGYAEEVDMDDDAFIGKLLAELLNSLPVDRLRIYTTGFSNGASMAMRAALRFPDHVAAVGAVAGHLWRREPHKDLNHLISLMFIVGDRDPLNPLSGGGVISPWGKRLQRPPVARTPETWAEWLGCASEPLILPAADGIQRLRYGPNRSGAEVDFLTIADAGHVWPGGPDILLEKIAGKRTDRIRATDVIWEFFTRHSKNAPATLTA